MVLNTVPNSPIFQSTLPVRGATMEGAIGKKLTAISIHAPRAGSDFVPGHDSNISEISIHAPRAGSDTPAVIRSNVAGISIHAPRAGSDAIR